MKYKNLIFATGVALSCLTGCSNTNVDSDSVTTEKGKVAEIGSHEHKWKAQYKTVVVPASYHEEDVLVKEALDVPVYSDQEQIICDVCGQDITSNAEEHMANHINNNQGDAYHVELVSVQVDNIHKDAVYQKQKVLDQEETSEKILTGYKCKTCGKTKSVD